MSYAGLDAGIVYKSDPFNGILGFFFQKSQGRRCLPKKSRQALSSKKVKVGGSNVFLQSATWVIARIQEYSWLTVITFKSNISNKFRLVFEDFHHPKFVKH